MRMGGWYMRAHEMNGVPQMLNPRLLLKQCISLLNHREVVTAWTERGCQGRDFIWTCRTQSNSDRSFMCRTVTWVVCMWLYCELCVIMTISPISFQRILQTSAPYGFISKQALRQWKRLSLLIQHCWYWWWHCVWHCLVQVTSLPLSPPVLVRLHQSNYSKKKEGMAQHRSTC